MPHLERRLSLDVVVPVAVGVTIVAFAAGSSSVAEVVQVGRTVRWLALLVLSVLAAIWAIDRRHASTLRPFVAVPASCLLGVALLSSTWSVDPRLTAERAATLVLLLVTSGALALACSGRTGAIDRVLAGLIGGAAVVAALGLPLLAIDHRAAVEQATLDLPARYRGFGENPNTVSLLLALCLPVAAWFVLGSSSRRRRVLALALGLFFDASIVASGSRGALIAGFAGVAAVAVLAPGRRLVRAARALAVAALLVASTAIALAPTSKGERAAQPKVPAQRSARPRSNPRYLDVQSAFPLEFDIGSPVPGEASPTHRLLFGLSGRGEAWRGAIDQADQRPALGHGFGTEDRVFVDRYANFAGGLPENSFIGLYLQLGATGLVVFLVLVAALVVAAVRALPRSEAAVSLGVLLAALVLACVQSYIYSVGNVGTAAVWICAFLGGGLFARRAAT
ncbi:MAG: O-antigen ligase family protein [Gaiellaceae bacterium]